MYVFLAFGTIDHHVHRQRRSAVKTFISKRTVRTTQVSIRAIVNDLCIRLDKYASSGGTFDVNLPYLAWSTDSVSTYLEDRPFGLLADDKRARNWQQTIQTVVKSTPVVKQISFMMPLVLQVPEWLMKMISLDMSRVLALHKVCMDFPFHRRSKVSEC